MRKKRRAVWWSSVILVPLIAAGLYWFQPWRLFTTTVVNESLPDVAAVELTTAAVATPATASRIPESLLTIRTTAATPAASTPSQTRSNGVTSSTPPPSARATRLGRGQLISHEHETSGSVSVIRLADGHRVLTLEGLRTSDGPDLHVWITDAPVRPGSDGWRVFDDGRHRDLGSLKGNVGDQVYAIGDDVDLSTFSSVSIWCERFSVSFGAAELRAS